MFVALRTGASAPFQGSAFHLARGANESLGVTRSMPTSPAESCLTSAANPEGFTGPTEGSKPLRHQYLTPIRTLPQPIFGANFPSLERPRRTTVVTANAPELQV